MTILPLMVFYHSNLFLPFQSILHSLSLSCSTFAIMHVVMLWCSDNAAAFGDSLLNHRNTKIHFRKGYIENLLLLTK